MIECFRTQLAAIEYEKPINSVDDLYNAGEAKYLKVEFLAYYEATMAKSGKKANRELYKMAVNNRERYTYSFKGGVYPKSLFDTVLAGE